MRILQVIQQLGQGGAEAVIMSLTEHSERAGHVTAVAGSPGSWSDRFGENTYSLPLIGRRPTAVPRATRALRRAIRDFRPDVVHCHNPGMALIGALATVGGRRPPALVTVHGVDEGAYAASARILRWTRLPVVSCGPGVTDALMANGCGVHCTVVNGVSPAPPPLTRDELGDRFHLDPSSPLLVSVGRLTAQKRHDRTLRALAEIPDATCLFLGEGPEEADLRRLARDLGVDDRAHFPGVSPQAREIMAAGDMVLMPSDWEGLPLVLIEAMMSGTPIVATRVRGIRELLNDGTDALLVEPDDVSSYTAAIRRLLDDSAMATSLAQAAKARSADYREAAMVSSYLRLYDQLAEGRRHPAARGQFQQASGVPATDGNPGMVVLHVTEALGGGILAVLKVLARAQTAAGARVTVLHTRRPDTPTGRQLDDIFGREVRRIEVARPGVLIRQLVSLATALRQIVRSESPDVIHLHSSWAGVIGRLVFLHSLAHRRRTLYSPHGWAFLREDQSAPVRLIYQVAEAALGPLCAGVICVSRSEADLGLRKALLRRIAILENRVDTSRLLVGPATRDVGSSSPTVCTAGRITFQKAPWRFAQLAQRFNQRASFVWFGSGTPDAEERWLNADVRVTGWLDASQLTRECSACDLFVLTSLWEGLPLALIEAQLLGLPAVVSDVPGCRDIVENGVNGFTVTSRMQLEERVGELLEDVEMRTLMGARAAEMARARFLDGGLGQESFEVYSRLLGRGFPLSQLRSAQ
jgi:glycosyltransferase involved in cell wall biosynthesis